MLLAVVSRRRMNRLAGAEETGSPLLQPHALTCVPGKVTGHIVEVTKSSHWHSHTRKSAQSPVTANLNIVAQAALPSASDPRGWGKNGRDVTRSLMDHGVYVGLLCKRLQWLLTAAV
jgi:hypothetical protein